MANKTKLKKPAAQPPLVNPPLHVELSDEHHQLLESIRRLNGWNKKTTIERALKAFDTKGGAQ